MGPFALMDLIGLDTSLAILEVLHRELGDPKYRPCPLLRQYVAAGWLGRKSGRGFHHLRRGRDRPGVGAYQMTAPGEPFVLTAREGAVVTLTVNRPEARNALDGPTLEALIAAFDAIDNDRSVPLRDPDRRRRARVRRGRRHQGDGGAGSRRAGARSPSVATAWRRSSRSCASR